jgi:hypothetical protein
LAPAVLALTIEPAPATPVAQPQQGQGRGGLGGLPPGQASPPQQPPVKGTGLILGQVVDAASGRAISDALVTVTSRMALAAPARGGVPAGPVKLMTGADGRFVLHDLPKGNVMITATASGYLNGSSGQARPGGPARPVEVDEGQRLSDVKIRLWKYAVLGGTVLDEAGDPAVGVSVRVLRRTVTPGKSGYSPAGSARTDDRGMYRVSSLTPGEYVVAVPQSLATIAAANADSLIQGYAAAFAQGSAAAMDIVNAGGAGALNPMAVKVGPFLLSSPSGSVPVAAADGRVFAYQTIFYPSNSTAAQASVVTLRSGDDRSGVDFQLRLVQTLRVSGTVTGPTDPVGSVSVRLLPAEVDEFGGDSSFDTATSVTAADGTFTFLGVPVGQYVARVVKQPRGAMPMAVPGGAAMMQIVGFAAAGPPAGAAATPTLYGQTSLTVGAADVTGVSLALGPGATVSGRVEFVGDAAKPTPQQLQAMTVTLASAGPSGNTPFGPGRVGQDGQFKTPGYPVGRYYVTAGGRAPWVLQSVTSSGRDVLNEPLELKDADVADVVVTYTDKVAQVTGNVHTSAGGPSTSATVILFPADFRAWIRGGMSPRQTRIALASKVGAYTFAGMLAGEYLVAALDDGDVVENQDAAFFEALSRVATRVTVAEAEHKTQDLQTVKVGK